MEGCSIQNDSNRNLDHLSQMIQHFFPYAQEKLGFFKPVMVSFQSDEENANKLLGRTAHYNPDDFSIAVYVDGRHPKDILRSFSHELVHHAQNCNGDFESAESLGPGYAQENEAMRNAELDAYKRGNIIFRDFEDLIKKGDIEIEIDFEKAGEPKMSLKEWKNNELNGLLMEKWGYKVQKEEQEIFAPNHYCAHHVRENISGLEGRCVDHNWNERLQEVTAYEVDFGDNDIRILRTEELTILEASLPEGHAGHMARKEDHEDEDVNEQNEDGSEPETLDEAGDFLNKLRNVRDVFRPSQWEDVLELPLWAQEKLAGARLRGGTQSGPPTNPEMEWLRSLGLESGTPVFSHDRNPRNPHSTAPRDYMVPVMENEDEHLADEELEEGLGDWLKGKWQDATGPKPKMTGGKQLGPPKRMVGGKHEPWHGSPTQPGKPGHPAGAEAYTQDMGPGAQHPGGGGLSDEEVASGGLRGIRGRAQRESIELEEGPEAARLKSAMKQADEQPEGPEEPEGLEELARWHDLAGLDEQDTAQGGDDDHADDDDSADTAAVDQKRKDRKKQLAAQTGKISDQEYADYASKRLQKKEPEGQAQKESITLDVARDLARRIFEELSKEIK